MKSGSLSFFAFLLFAIVISFKGLVAQNWNPFPANRTYYFRYNAAGGLPDGLHAVRFDTATVESGDSVWYFNRITRPQDSAQSCWISYYYNVRVLNSDNVFGGKMIRKLPDHYLFVYDSGDTMYLYPEAPAGFTWNFHPAAGVTATCDTVIADTILGIPDSVRVYNLSNGKVLRLSKTFGFTEVYSFLPVQTLKFQSPPPVFDYTLHDIPEISGNLRPVRFEDIFDFDIGDEYQIQDYYYNEFFGSYYSSDQHISLLITGKTVAPDSSEFSYTAFRKEVNFTLELVGTFWLYDTLYGSNPAYTFSYKKPDYPMLDLLPMAEYAVTNCHHLGGMVYHPGWNNRLERQFEFGWALDTCANGYDEDTISGIIRPKLFFGEGIGITFDWYSDFSNVIFTKLLCYRKATDSAGVCSDIPLALKPPFPASPPVKVHPNPAAGYFFAELPENYHAVEWQLVSLQGAVAASGTGTGKVRIATEYMPAGYYIFCLPELGARSPVIIR